LTNRSPFALALASNPSHEPTFAADEFEIEFVVIV
jgi:hypothetical protein